MPLRQTIQVTPVKDLKHPNDVVNLVSETLIVLTAVYLADRYLKSPRITVTSQDEKLVPELGLVDVTLKVGVKPIVYSTSEAKGCSLHDLSVRPKLFMAVPVFTL